MFEPLVLQSFGHVRPTLFVDELGFDEWMADARVGAELVYFHGYLADARESGYISDKNRSLLNRVADLAQQKARAGAVMLFQRRKDNAFDYVARRLPARPR